MKIPKDGYYTVYLLPAEWYVGYTGDTKTRMKLHTHNGKDISNWTILAEFIDKRDALDVEAHYHSKGYKGNQFTPESVIKRVNNTDYTSAAIKRNLNTDWDKRNAKMDFEVINSPKRKVILQYNKEDKLIKEWASITEASIHFGVHWTAISNCLRGKCKTTAGFKWRYKN